MNNDNYKSNETTGPQLFFMTVLGVIGISAFVFMDSFFASSPNSQQTNKSKTFYNYNCTSDCSGHEAGYNWAEEKGINNSDDCGGNSNSFIEGCKAYVEEKY